MKNNDDTPLSAAKNTKKAYVLLKRLCYIGAVTLGFISLLIGAFLFYLSTEAGLKNTVRLVNELSGEAVYIEGIEGQLWRDIDLYGIQIQTEQRTIKIDSLHLSWQPRRLFSGVLHIQQLALGATRIDTKPHPFKKDEVEEVPEQLTLPLAVNVENMSLSRLALDSESALLEDVSMILKSDGIQHQLILQRMVNRLGQIDGQIALNGKAPFNTNARFALRSNEVNQPLSTATLKLEGPLRNLQVSGLMQYREMHADIDVLLDLLAPLDYQLIRQGQIVIDGFDPRFFVEETYQANLSLRMHVHPGENGVTVGQLLLKNASPTAFDLGGVPLHQLDMHWQMHNNRVEIDKMDLAIGKVGKLRGKGVLEPQNFSLNFGVQALDANAFWSTAKKSALMGEAYLEGAYITPNMTIALKDPVNELGVKLQTGWRTSLKEHTLLVKELLLTQRAGRLSATAEWGLSSGLPFRVDMTMDGFDPAKFGQYPQGDLNLSFRGEGHLLPTASININYFFRPSQFNGFALSGKGALVWHDQMLREIDVATKLGSNSLTIKGKYNGELKDRLRVEMAMPHLAQLGESFAGQLEGYIDLQGNPKNYALQTDLKALGVKLPGALSVHQLSVESHIHSEPEHPLNLTFKGAHIEVNHWKIQDIEANIQGTRANHTIGLEGHGHWKEHAIFVDTKMTGGFLINQQWKGLLQKFKGGFAERLFALKSTAKLELSRNNMRVEDLTLKSENSHIILDHFVINETGKIDTQGKIIRFDIADVKGWLPETLSRSDLVLQGTWQLNVDKSVDGKLELKKQAGDIVWHREGTGTQPTRFQIESANLIADIQHARVNLNSHIHTHHGKLKLDAVATLSQEGQKWGLYASSPLTLHTVANIPNLQVFSPLISPTLKLSGQLNADMTRKGTLARGDLSGRLSGKGLAIQDTFAGIHLTDGAIDARLTNDYLTVGQCTFTGGSGTIQAHGKMSLHNQNTDIDIRAEHFTLFSRPDRRIVLSGNASMFMKNQALTLQGKVRLDEGKIQLATDVPTLSNDVVIMNRAVPKVAKPNYFILTNLSLDVDLGKKTTYKGYGLEALLGGELHITSQNNQPLYTAGVVRINEGRYKAYGQDLTIERGFISFQGPLDNPGLDIVAMRKGMSVEVGIQLVGTAFDPRLILISDPPVSDNEKLSWLIFGKGTDTLNPQDGATVLMALSSLLTGGDTGAGLSQKIADMVGLDEIGIKGASSSSNGATPTTYLTLGKRLANNLYLSYEQGLGEMDSALKLQYILSRYWQAVARAGNKETTFDIFYTISFD